MEHKRAFYITILDGAERDMIVNLASYQKDEVTFGRSSDNDIVLNSSLVSKKHGHFAFNGESWVVHDDNSTNGIFWNNSKIPSKRLIGGDKLLIGYETTGNKVAFLFSDKSPQNVYHKYSLAGKNVITIGRDIGCDIRLSYQSVFKQHCRIVLEQDGYHLERAYANAPIQYNGSDLRPHQKLFDMDRFMIGDTQFVYRGGMLHYIQIAEGLSFEVSHLCKDVGKGNKKKRINNNVNFSVNAGEFVAIIGGSGAGKSTLLNCLCGSSSISEGNVTIGGEDLTANYNSLKNLIGYVPQQDIVYDNLTLERMLYYTAKLRAPQDSGAEEIQTSIDQALALVKLSDRKDVMIKSLSGGQKKRASIAVELLSDPKLFFLDEPTSGLDPGTERNLMITLKEMAGQGKTVVLVTHTPLNLNLCDKIVVMGSGGRLCYFGDPDGALEFFGVDNLVDIYDLINNDAATWSDSFDKKRTDTTAGGFNRELPPGLEKGMESNKKGTSSLRQTVILVKRYVELQLHDTKRLLIQLLMAPGLGLLLYAAFKDSYPFEASGDTQKLALTLACCAFWVGLFNSIQEICKEGQIYKRERMANLKLFPYVGSKLIVNGVFDLLQTILLVGVVAVLLGMPDQGMQWSGAPFMEIWLTTYLTMLSATCIGLVVSALVNNSDQAISFAPILLIPQILFSGIIVELKGIIDTISYIISCRYACVAYCTTADINNLPTEFKMTALGVEEGETAIVSVLYSYTGNVNSVIESIFGNSFAQAISNPVMGGWLALLFLSLIATILTVVALRTKARK